MPELNAPTERVNLLGLNRREMEAFFAEMGEKAFRASQVMKWIYHRGVEDFAAMTDLSKALREKLAARAEIRTPEVVADHPSADGTRKWVLRLDCGNSIETVYIPESDRATLCVSSQAGCSLNCSFCSTARQGFNRNLGTAEIVGQIFHAVRTLGFPENLGDRVITNVVLMGMGEPLMNFENVVRAIDVMLEDNAFGISKRRVTLSTAGVVPALHQLREVSDVSLAVSLHAPTDELRDELVPINRKYPIAELLEACRAYIADKPHRSVTFEYVLLAGVNDQPEHARALAKLMRTVSSKVNLIPFNTFDGAPYLAPTEDAVERFRHILVKSGVNTIIRKTRGDDISAACGQLVGQVTDRTRRSDRFRGVPVQEVRP